MPNIIGAVATKFSPWLLTFVTSLNNTYIFVLGVDDIVRVWNVSDGELRLKNKLTDHSLGVVA